MSASYGTTLRAIAMIALLARAATCQSGAPAAAPSLATAAQTLKAVAPATAEAISSALTGPSAACLIPANAPIVADDPTASVSRPLQQSSSHAAQVDSAGAPAAAPSLATAAKTLKAEAPTTAEAISSALTGSSAACLIPASGGVLINAPIMADNPTASVARPLQQSSSHAAQVDSADDFWGDLGAVVGSLFPVAAAGVGAYGYATNVDEGLPVEALPGVDQLPEGFDLGAVGEIGALALSTAQVDSVSLDDFQEGDVAAADSSFNQVKGTALADPIEAARAAVAVGKPVIALAPGTTLTVDQNSAVLAPKPQPQASSPTTLPSSVVAGLAVGKAAVESSGRKMLESASAAPACCNSYTVKQGDTLNSIATTYGQPTNGPAILQAINGLNGMDVSPGQSLMLPCGRVLTYYAAFNAAAGVSKTASSSSSSG